MTPETEFEMAVTRLATMTSVIRTRERDLYRREVNGGKNGELHAKVAEAAKKLKKVADSLEKAIA